LTIPDPKLFSLAVEVQFYKLDKERRQTGSDYSVYGKALDFVVNTIEFFTTESLTHKAHFKAPHLLAMLDTLHHLTNFRPQGVLSFLVNKPFYRNWSEDPSSFLSHDICKAFIDLDVDLNDYPALLAGLWLFEIEPYHLKSLNSQRPEVRKVLGYLMNLDSDVQLDPECLVKIFESGGHDVCTVDLFKEFGFSLITYTERVLRSSRINNNVDCNQLLRQIAEASPFSYARIYDHWRNTRLNPDSLYSSVQRLGLATGNVNDCRMNAMLTYPGHLYEFSPITEHELFQVFKVYPRVVTGLAPVDRVNLLPAIIKMGVWQILPSTIQIVRT
jgi:hypothetical protein